MLMWCFGDYASLLHAVTIVEEMASESVLETANEWLCMRRKDYPNHADVWWFRFHWPCEKSHIQSNLLSGDYRMQPQSVVTNRDGEVLHLYSARDARVLKALTTVLRRYLPVSKRCVHVKGHGGAKSAVRAVRKHLPRHRFVLKTDIKSYYASIDHHLLLEQISVHIKDQFILNLLWQYMHRISQRGGLFTEHESGIPRGCALIPLIGAFFLDAQGRQMERLGLYYVRFTDDILVLAPTRWKLRRAVKILNETFNRLKLDNHADKIFIGKIDKGFDFLVYHFSLDRLTVATATLVKFVERAIRLYEREQENPKGSPQPGLYVQRWVSWVEGGLGPIRKAPPERGFSLLYVQ